MFKKLFILLLLPFMAHLSAVDPANIPSYSVKEAPIWVDLFEYDLNPTPSSEEIKEGYKNVLFDKQENWEDKTTFKRLSRKILSKKGAKNENGFYVLYNSTCEQAVLHSVRVYRDGVWLDFLPKTNLKVYPRDVEEGTLKRIEIDYSIKDLQPGDIFEVQYSTQGTSPFLSKYINEKIKLYSYDNPELCSYRLIASPLHILNVKGCETETTMKVQNLSSSFREWSIQFKPAKTSWSHSNPYIVISEYPSWNTVAQELLPMLNASTAFTNAPSKEAQKLTAEWMDQSKDPHEQARLAVRFIQNEFESYSHSIEKYQPKDLNTVLDERDGDSYDKMLLLHGFLNLMGISSTPILTEDYGDSIQNGFPQHKSFDSAILRIAFADMSLYVDPNEEDEIGPLESNLLSTSYKIGLPLSADTSELVTLPLPELRYPTKIVTTISSIDSDHIEIRTETVFYGPKANELRNRDRYDESKIEKISKDKLQYMNIYYNGSKILEPLQWIDNEKLNTVTTIESYSVPLKYPVNFSFRSEIFNIFSIYRLNEEQKTPHSLRFPEWVQQEVHIELPELIFLRKPFSDEIKHEHDCLYYHYTCSGNEKSVDFSIELKYLQKEVDPSQVPSYNKLVGIINKNNGITLSF